MSNRAGRVLVVEDAKDIQTLLASFLRSQGYNVDCASNGVEALEYLNQAAELPKVILLDLMMPKMDGYQFRSAQERNPQFASIPVVVMTADGDIQVKALRAGAISHLKKPFVSLEVILDTVDRTIRAN